MNMKDKTEQQSEHWKVLVLLLAEITKEKGISQNDIAELTGLKQSNISRMFNLQYCPTLRNFISIANSIKVNFFFEDQENKTDLSVLFEKAMAEMGRRVDKLPKN